MNKKVPGAERVKKVKPSPFFSIPHGTLRTFLFPMNQRIAFQLSVKI